MFCLIEYYHNGRDGVEYPMVFVGTEEECLRKMQERYERAHEVLHGSDDLSYCEPDDRHAIYQDEEGEWRYEWWVNDLDEDRQHMRKENADGKK